MDKTDLCLGPNLSNPVFIFIWPLTTQLFWLCQSLIITWNAVLPLEEQKATREALTKVSLSKEIVGEC